MKNPQIVIDEYSKLPSPNKFIAKDTVIYALPIAALYILFAVIIPSFPHAFSFLGNVFFDSVAAYNSWIEEVNSVPKHIVWNRLVFLIYITTYIVMWKVYFKSKMSPDPHIEAKRLKIRSLRRLLGMTSLHWATVESDEDNSLFVDNYKKKSEISMIVIALLIATTILIFEQISSVLLKNVSYGFWQDSTLWIAAFFVIISFVSLMLCVDSLDTIYNNFRNNVVRNSMISYFQRYTINPRYVATSAMFFSIILWISFHSILLASLTVVIIFYIGYPFWFPTLKLNKENDKNLSLGIVALLCIIPVLIHILM